LPFKKPESPKSKISKLDEQIKALRSAQLQEKRDELEKHYYDVFNPAWMYILRCGAAKIEAKKNGQRYMSETEVLKAQPKSKYGKYIRSKGKTHFKFRPKKELLRFYRKTEDGFYHGLYVNENELNRIPLSPEIKKLKFKKLKVILLAIKGFGS